VKNLENIVRPIAIDSFGMVVPSDPRTWGLRLDYRF
jgi:iron complex outermembrane receptor protein